MLLLSLHSNTYLFYIKARKYNALIRMQCLQSVRELLKNVKRLDNALNIQPQHQTTKDFFVNFKPIKAVYLEQMLFYSQQFGMAVALRFPKM